MSRFVALFLAFTLALTAQAFALARGQASAAGEVAICAGGSLVMIAVDAQGNPTGPAHFCPDAITALATAVPAPPLPAHPAVLVAQVDGPSTLLPRLPAPQLGAQARAPPVPV